MGRQKSSLRGGISVIAVCILLVPAGLLTLARARGEQGAAGPIEALRTMEAARSRKSVEGPRPTISVNANLVLIPVSVVDLRDRMVLGLAKDQFKVYDEGVEQSITHFATQDAPASVCFVVDCSASMGKLRLKESRGAVMEIMRMAKSDDEFALVQFNERVARLVDLTTRTVDIERRLSLLQSRGQTALLDAIYLAVNTMKRARHSRKAIVLISDGGDNCSRYSVQETRQFVREADVQVFAIGISDPGEKRTRSSDEKDGTELLRAIAEETGGRLFPIGKPNQLRDVAVQIGRTLRNEYVLGFSPSNVDGGGKYHRLQVRLPGMGGARVFSRSGYYDSRM
jgi:VWFA-related protein